MKEKRLRCVCMYLCMNVHDGINCRQPVLAKVLVQVQELPLPRYIIPIYMIQCHKSGCFNHLTAQDSFHSKIGGVCYSAR